MILGSNCRSNTYSKSGMLGLLLVSALLAVFMSANQTVMAQVTTFSLELFEGNQPSDRTVGLHQEVRAVVLIATLVDMTIETDKDSYTEGDAITISGKVGTIHPGQPVLIRVFTPDDALARTDPVSVNSRGEYTYTFPSGGPLMPIEGMYRVEANYGSIGVGTFFMFELADAATIAQVPLSQEDVVIFRWINPGGDTVREATVAFSNREDTFAPDQPGEWIVQADIIIGVTIATVSSPLSVPFFVLPESPVGAVAMVVTSLSALGGFLYFKSRNKTSGN